MNSTGYIISNFRQNSGAGSFFTSIAIWGIGVGCYAAALNNYLADIYSITEFERGVIELFRELPGFALIFILALLHRVSDWKILRLGTACSMLAAIALLIPADKIFLTFLMTLFSTGEHIVMPVRQSLSMQVAKPGHEGASLGFMTCVMNAGTIIGSLLVAVVFWCGLWCFHCRNSQILYNVLWILIAVLLTCSVLSTFSRKVPNHPSDRPRLYFHRKFNKFYILEIFYGARKQIFLTFAPYVLIIVYGLTTPQVALLMGISALINMFGGPLVGRITDKLGYRTIMIWDTLILFWVCLAYGFADNIFPRYIALIVVSLNYLLDGLISTASLATNIYVRQIASDANELTSTLSTGISVNHLISILIAPTGGFIWTMFGVGWLFVFASIMALLNTAFAWTLPHPTVKRSPTAR